VTDPVDQPRRGGGRVFAVFLAVLFLAVIGSAAGYVAGRQVQEHRAQQRGGQTGDLPGPDQTSDSASPPGTPPRLTGTHCPDASEKDANTQLIQVLYLRTAQSRVWICRDVGGGLYYQGLRGTGDVFTNDNAILLPDVSDSGDGTYVALNKKAEGTTKYTVSKKSLVIEKPSQGPTTEPAVSTGSG
jgi:hypothetical protein